MNTKRLRSSFLLLLTAFIWGVAFVAQKEGMEYIGPFTFNAIRSIIGSIVLLPVIALFGDKSERTRPPEERRKSRKTLIIGGICCGVALAVAANFQQFGVKYTTVGKSGFITAMYIIIVPLLGLFLKKKPAVTVWISVVIAVVGMYLLCISEQLSLGRGDLLVLICAFCFSIHILVIDYFSPRVDGVKLSCIQFFVSGILSLIAMFIFEQPELTSILNCWLPILYAGILSCGVAYTLQIIGQKGMDPTVASLILSLESVFAMIMGVILLHERMSVKEWIGCGLMFLAIVLAQLPAGKKDKSLSS